MPDKFLCVIATFDDEASKQMKALDCLLKRADISGKQTPDLQHHITLAYFDVDNTDAWTAHATLLIDEPESIHKALDLISKEFHNMTATIQALHLYEFFPTRLIASYELK